jgi:hypothetical protein
MNDETRRLLETDGGLYLGTVIVRHYPGARWHIWPNGHPVVRLPSGGDLDMVAAVSNRARTRQPGLAAFCADTFTERAS